MYHYSYRLGGLDKVSFQQRRKENLAKNLQLKQEKIQQRQKACSLKIKQQVYDNG